MPTSTIHPEIIDLDSSDDEESSGIMIKQNVGLGNQEEGHTTNLALLNTNTAIGSYDEKEESDEEDIVVAAVSYSTAEIATANDNKTKASKKTSVWSDLDSDLEDWQKDTPAEASPKPALKPKTHPSLHGQQKARINATNGVAAITKFKTKTTTTTKTTTKTATASMPLAIDLSSSSDDDSLHRLILQQGPTFGRRTTTTTKNTIGGKKGQFEEPPTNIRITIPETEKQNNVDENTTDRRKRLRQEQCQKKNKEEKERQKKQKAEDSRVHARILREASKQTEKQTKQQKKDQAKQASGKFAQDEICVVLEPSLRTTQKETIDTLEETYPTANHRGALRGTISYIRRDFLAGGAKHAIRSFQQDQPEGYELLDRVTVVFSDPKEFLDLMERGDNEDDYPFLERWINTNIAAWQSKWRTTKKPKIVILLPGVREEICRQWNARKKSKERKPITDAELEDAIVWLRIQFRIDCQLYKQNERDKESFNQYVLEFILKFTRTLSEAPYKQPVTELECIKKIKSGLDNPANAIPLDRARDTWLRQLQMIPKVSEKRAFQLVQSYPTPRSLWEAYQDPSRTVEEKKALLAQSFCEKGYQRSLSESVYKLMKPFANPNDLL